MKRATALLAFVCLNAGHAVAADPVPEHWLPVQRVIGNWSGTASGDAGEGTVQRRYAFVMSGRFIHETNLSTYPPREKNNGGEVHEHWGVFSFDKAREAYEFLSDDEFVETFELAPPGKQFRSCSRNHFKRSPP